MTSVPHIIVRQQPPTGGVLQSLPQGWPLPLCTASRPQSLSCKSIRDHSTSGGELVFHVSGTLAEFERDLIRERTAGETRRQEAAE